MATLKDVKAYLDGLVDAGDVLKYEVVQDTGEKIVVNVVFKKGDDEYISKNYVLFVRDRGTDTETVYWNDRKLELPAKQEKIPDKLLGAMQSELTSKFKMVVLLGYSIDMARGIIDVTAYCAIDVSKLQLKRFIITFDKDTGDYKIYEVVGEVVE